MARHEDRAPGAPGAPAAPPAGDGWELNDAAGFSELVGPIWKRVRDGRLELGLTIEPKHLNRGGIVHGGMLMTFCDQVMSMGAKIASGGKPHATIQIDVQFIGAVKTGAFLHASAQVTRCTRSLIFVTGQLSNGSDIVATASSVQKIREER